MQRVAWDCQLPRLLPVLGSRNTAWTRSVCYFSLSQKLIFRLKVRDNAGICIQNFKKKKSGVTPQTGLHCGDVAVLPAPTHHGRFGSARGQVPPVLGHRLWCCGASRF